MLTNSTGQHEAPAASPSNPDGRWIHLVDPKNAQIDALHGTFGVSRTLITHALDIDELARVEQEGTTTLIVLRVPYRQGATSAIPYITVPLGIILQPPHIITLSKWQTGLVSGLHAKLGDELTAARPERVVLEILLRTADAFVRHVREINTAVDMLEGRLQHSQRNREVLELLKYQKCLTHFTTALQMNELLLERLQQSPLLRDHPDDADLIADVLTEMRQALAMTRIAGDILSQMMDAFASIISNNLNVVMKFLAAFTIVLTFPTMIASFYGMNVVLPAQQAPYAFALTVGLSLAVSLVATLLLYKRGWL